MVHRKIISALGLLLLLSACKKNIATVQISVTMAHTNTPIGGSMYRLVELKSKGIGGFDIEETGYGVSGIVGPDGKASFSLKTKASNGYDMYFDHSTMNVPSGDYEIVQGPTGFAGNINENGENVYEIRILPKMAVQFNFKNENCSGSTDTFRYKSFNIDEEPHLNQNQIDSRPWLEGSSLNGCVDFVGPFAIRLAGHYVFYWEASRNGILDTGIDTFYVSPDGNNVIEMFW